MESVSRPSAALGPHQSAGNVLASLRFVAGRIPEIVYAALGMLLIPALRSTYATVDGVSYMSVAEHLAHGQFGAGVNGFWSPLLSWLLVPAVWLGLPLPLAAIVINLAASVMVLDRLRRLCVLAQSSGWIIDVLLLGTIPLLLYATFDSTSPDLLLAALLLAALTGLLDEQSSPRRRGVRFGAWGGAAVLAKAFALPFLVVFAVAWALIEWLRRRGFEDRRSIVTTISIGLMPIALVTLAWSIALTIKYQEPTVSRTATYHAEITAPGARGDPFGWAGLIRPTSPDAVSGWEDPSLIATPDGQLVNVGPSQDVDGQEGRTERIRQNLRGIEQPVELLIGSALAAGLAGLGAIVLAVADRCRRPAPTTDKRGPGPWLTVHLVSAAAIFVGGLSLVVIETRYLWAPLLLSVPGTAWATEWLRRRWPSPAVSAIAVSAACMISAASILAADRELDRLGDRTADRNDMLVDVAPLVGPGDRVASMPLRLRFTGVCLDKGCTYWGKPVASAGPDLADELTAAGIDRLVVSGSVDDVLGEIGLDNVVATAADRPTGEEITVLDVSGVER